ncbi:MAG: hypothetical protein ACXWQO_15510, partial [Bdellovibrionota bacterium]
MKLIALTLTFLALTSTAFADRTSCELPADQGRGSLFGQWDQLPIKLVLDAEFYRADNGIMAMQLKKAVKTWNRWAAAKGKVAFVIEKDGIGQEIPALTDCSQASYTAQTPEAVGVWKIASEGSRKNQRESCMRQADGTLGKILPNGVQGQTDWITLGGRIQASSIMLNFDDFNSKGRPFVDMESVLLHQLGHVLGLLNSCNGSSRDSVDGTSAPACSAAPKEYTEAVMAPYLRFREIKRNLTKN